MGHYLQSGFRDDQNSSGSNGLILAQWTKQVQANTGMVPLPLMVTGILLLLMAQSWPNGQDDSGQIFARLL